MLPVQWIQLGEIDLCSKGWPKFPVAAKVAGLYRIRLRDGWIYIGQARNLHHRLYEYRRPTPGVVQEHSIHRAIVLAKGAAIDIFVSEELQDIKLRCALEEEEIEKAKVAGATLLNGGQNVEAYRLQLDMEYHERELKTLRAKLSELQLKDESYGD